MDAGGFTITVDRDGGAVRLALAGELDLSRVAVLDEAIAQARASSAGHLELDLRELTFIDSSGLKAFVSLHQAAAGGEFTYALISGPPTVHRTFVLTGLDQVLRFAEVPA
jgi:anti-anti-sigma factor